MADYKYICELNEEDWETITDMLNLEKKLQISAVMTQYEMVEGRRIGEKIIHYEPLARDPELLRRYAVLGKILSETLAEKCR